MRFQWVKTYAELEGHSINLKSNLVKSERELYRWVYGDLKKVKLEEGSKSSSLEENIDRMKNEIDRVEKDKKELLSMINAIEDIDHKIIKLRYIDGMALEDIADNLGYSISHMRKRYTLIRKELTFLAGGHGGLYELYEKKRQ